MLMSLLQSLRRITRTALSWASVGGFATATMGLVARTLGTFPDTVFRSCWESPDSFSDYSLVLHLDV